MRKLKKINGYLIVRFNDRERRSWERLGFYGVINAELYTGDIDLDLDAMEYSDAETIEQAVEQARSLDAEVDISDPVPSYTIVAETDDSFGEEAFSPKALIQGMEERLKKAVGNRDNDLDALGAAQELEGYKAALRDLGVITALDAAVEPDHFAGDAASPLPKHPEALLTHICDNICREVLVEGRTPDELEEICGRCQVERLVRQADAQELRVLSKVKERIAGLTLQVREANLESIARFWTTYTRGYIAALGDSDTLTQHDREVYDALLEDAEGSRPYRAQKSTFDNLEPRYRDMEITRRMYALGLALRAECPDNDCTLYLHNFEVMVQMDEVLGDLSDKPAAVRALRSELHSLFHTLQNLFLTNPAIMDYREGMQL